MIRFVKKIIEKFVNVAKSGTRCVDRYVFEFATIFLSLMIYNCFNSLRFRRWIFVEISTLFWSLIIESTNAIISSTSFFDFAIFVVVLRCKKITSFRWRTYSIRAKQHVSNCSIYEQKKTKDFFRIQIYFSKLSCIVCDWFVKWICLFLLFLWRKKWKRLSFSKVNNDWWWFNFLTNFSFLVFVIF